MPEPEVETRYFVELSIVVGVMGTPNNHTRREIYEAALARLAAGDEEDIDKIEVICTEAP